MREALNYLINLSVSRGIICIINVYHRHIYVNVYFIKKEQKSNILYMKTTLNLYATYLLCIWLVTGKFTVIVSL